MNIMKKNMEWNNMATEFVVFFIENTATRLGFSGDRNERYKEMKRLDAIELFFVFQLCYSEYPKQKINCE